MIQQLEDAFYQALTIVRDSPAATFLLAAALIYMAFDLLGVAKKSIL